jgi:hypothetical protein
VEREVQTGAFNDTYVQILGGLEVGEVVLLNPLPFTDSAAASFQQNPPTPEGAAPPVDTSDSPRRGESGGMRQGFGGGGRGGMQFDPENMTDEQRQQYEQFMQNRGSGSGRGGAGGFGGGGSRRGGGGGRGFGGGGRAAGGGSDPGADGGDL